MGLPFETRQALWLGAIRLFPRDGCQSTRRFRSRCPLGSGHIRPKLTPHYAVLSASAGPLRMLKEPRSADGPLNSSPRGALASAHIRGGIVWKGAISPSSSHNMSEKRNPNEREIDTPLDLDDKAEIAHFEGEKEHHDLHTTLIEEALAQAEEESKMGLWKNFKLYYPGATFGLLLSVALVMEGYDTGLVSLTISAFRSKLPQPLCKLCSLTSTGQQLLRPRRLPQEIWDLSRREWEDFDSCGLASRCKQCSLRWSDPRSPA
jgi:hypothetical protein